MSQKNKKQTGVAVNIEQNISLLSWVSVTKIPSKFYGPVIDSKNPQISCLKYEHTTHVSLQIASTTGWRAVIQLWELMNNEINQHSLTC